VTAPTRTQKLTEQLIETAPQVDGAGKTVAKRADPARDLLASMQDEFAAALPKALPVDLFTRVALTGFRKTPELLACDRRSLLGALLETARLGLEPCTEQAYLIPYKNECTLVIGYQGFVQLFYRTGQVAMVEAEMIYEGDEWEDSRGDGGRFYHRPNWTAEDRGRPILAYAYASLVGGGRTKVEIVTRERAERIKREYARSSKSPWNAHFDAMWQKSAVRALAKWAPRSAELRRAVVVDEATYDVKGDGHTVVGEVLTAEVVEDQTPEPAADSPTPEPAWPATAKPADAQ